MGKTYILSSCFYQDYIDEPTTTTTQEYQGRHNPNVVQRLAYFIQSV